LASIGSELHRTLLDSFNLNSEVRA
jgi:hypothetical protein